MACDFLCRFSLHVAKTCILKLNMKFCSGCVCSVDRKGSQLFDHKVKHKLEHVVETTTI